MAKKENGFMGMMKDGLSFISQIISARLFDQIIEGADKVMGHVEDRAMSIQKNILRKISAIMAIWFGAALLIFALFFFLKEFFNWNNSAAFLLVGIIVFVVGLILQLGGSNK